MPETSDPEQILIQISFSILHHIIICNDIILYTTALFSKYT